MNKRRVSIINELNKIEKNISLSDLAEQFEVSQRTIRNDLSVINEILRENQLPELELGVADRYVGLRSFRGYFCLYQTRIIMHISCQKKSGKKSRQRC